MLEFFFVLILLLLICVSLWWRVLMLIKVGGFCCLWLCVMVCVVVMLCGLEGWIGRFCGIGFIVLMWRVWMGWLIVSFLGWGGVWVLNNWMSWKRLWKLVLILRKMVWCVGVGLIYNVLLRSGLMWIIMCVMLVRFFMIWVFYMLVFVFSILSRM